MNKQVKITLITLSVPIIFYFMIGLIINYSGMKIYFSNSNYELSGQNEILTLTATIQNNAPLTLPFSNPLFYYGVNISDNNISCTFASHNCSENIIIDIGKIESGQSKSLEIKIIPNNNSNFMFDVYSYLNTFNTGILKKSISINCIVSNDSENRDKNYLCNERRRS